MTMLLIAGIAALAVGLLAIVFGMPIKEFSFGNTLILAGAAAACTGLILIGLAMVVRELQRIGRRLAAANPAVDIPKANPALALPAGDRPAGALAKDRDGPALPAPQDESRARPEGTPEAGEPEPPPAPKRRNLLFSSSRKERERPPPPAEVATVTRPSGPPLTPPPKEAAPPTFDDAWPQSDRARSDPLRRTRSPSTFSEPNAAPAAPERAAPSPPPAPPAPEEPAPVTVLKSGVVDGMAYSLYSDGSIEAQMPEGMMRFASIDELRSHLDHRP